MKPLVFVLAVVPVGLATAVLISAGPSRAADDDRAERELRSLKRQVEKLAGDLADTRKELKTAQAELEKLTKAVRVSGSNVEIRAGYGLDIMASKIRFNRGSKPIAHVGSAVKDGKTVSSGSRDILAP